MSPKFEIEWIEGRPKEFQAGMLLKFEAGFDGIFRTPNQNPPVYLVGDVNDLGGSCNCCPGTNGCVAYSTSLVGLVNSVKGMK